MDDPSNIRPSVKTSASNVSTGTVKCWIVPGRSQNLTSINSPFSASMKLRYSSALLNDINPPCTGRAYVGLTSVIVAACGLDPSRVQFPAGVPDVSLMLRACSVPPCAPPPGARPEKGAAGLQKSPSGYRGAVSDEPPDPRRASPGRLAAAPHAHAGDTTPGYPRQTVGPPPQRPGSVPPLGRA